MRCTSAAGADLKICLLSCEETFSASSSGEVTARVDDLTLAQIDRNTIILLNKLDTLVPSTSTLPPSHLAALAALFSRPNRPTLAHATGLSLATRVGLAPFLQSLERILVEKFEDGMAGGGREDEVVVQERHRVHLEVCRDSLAAFLRTFVPFVSCLISLPAFPSCS